MPVVGGVESATDDVDDGLLGKAGFSAMSDALELVCAPPVLCAAPLRGSGAADGSIGDGTPTAVDDPDEFVVNDGEAELAAGTEPEEGLEVLVLSVDDEADDVGEPEGAEDEEPDDPLGSDGFASATPGMVASANPTPSATASAPTRPI